MMLDCDASLASGHHMIILCKVLHASHKQKGTNCVKALTMVSPLIHLAAGLARKTAAMAMSQGCCILPSGSMDSILSDVPPSSFAMPAS